MTTDDQTLAATKEEREASLEKFDPGELSLISGHYLYNIKASNDAGEAITKEIKIPRLTLRQKIKFQKFVASETTQIQKLLTNNAAGTGIQL